MLVIPPTCETNKPSKLACEGDLFLVTVLSKPAASNFGITEDVKWRGKDVDTLEAMKFSHYIAIRITLHNARTVIG